jgi:hypothetical protein
MKAQARNAGFAMSRQGDLDTEYYSACGWDDYCAETARWKWVDAQACARAWCKLIHS